MKYLLLLFILSGCGTLEPFSDGARPKPTTTKLKPLEQKIEDCVYKFIERFGTEIEKTYKVCHGIYRKNKLE